jgi:hypothetical protein
MDYHSDRFQDHSLMFYNEKNRLIAVLPANSSLSASPPALPRREGAGKQKAFLLFLLLIILDKLVILDLLETLAFTTTAASEFR